MSTSLTDRMERHRAAKTTAKASSPSPRREKLVQAHVPAEVSRALKQLALDEDKTQQALVVEALNDLFRSRGLPPVA